MNKTLLNHKIEADRDLIIQPKIPKLDFSLKV